MLRRRPYERECRTNSSSCCLRGRGTRLESGHHGDSWLDLELLLLHPKRVQPFAAEIAARLASYDIEAVCGPLVEGAFVALLVTSALGVPFSYAAPCADARTDVLHRATYGIPSALRASVCGKRVAIVDDMINAGSAVRGTYADLKACGAEPVAIATLLVLGQSAAHFAADHALSLETLSSLPNTLWTPSECPLRASNIPLTQGLGPDDDPALTATPRRAALRRTTCP